MFTEWQLAITLMALLTLPGWAILSLNQQWRRWETLQRWCLAVAISIAFYPVLFYAARLVLPSFSLGPFKLVSLLAACAAIIAWHMRATWREQLAFDRLEWAALAIFGLTLFTRFWIIRDHPYPAWTDSLHHVLLTQLTAISGRLPIDMQPYAPVPLGQYHLGLYALSGSLEMLTRVPSHTALLWMAQALNGLSGIGVYLVLGRLTGRMGAIVGAAVVGLFSLFPAWYVNWGRFTQGASQAVLLVAWFVTWQAVSSWKQRWSENRNTILWQTGIAALLTGAVFLLHFRVAGFYFPLLGLAVAYELYCAWGEHRVRQIALGTFVVGFGALLVVTPALWEALRIYVTTRALTAPIFDAAQVALQEEMYFGLAWHSALKFIGDEWLVGLAVAGAIVGLLRRNKLIVAVLLWSAVLIGMGEAYLLKVPVLALSNLSGILIMFYLPMGLVIGAAAEETLNLMSEHWRAKAARVVLAATLIIGFITSYSRATAVEPFRYFVTPADVAAMDWIKNNTPPDAQFAINTWFWLPTFPVGTDAGYWIPYFTGRKTTASSMLFKLGQRDYIVETVALSRTVKLAESDAASVEDLRASGVAYVYLGSKENSLESRLDYVPLSHISGVSIVYQVNGVSILKIDGSLDRANGR